MYICRKDDLAYVSTDVNVVKPRLYILYSDLLLSTNHHGLYCRPKETYFHSPPIRRFNPLTHLFCVLALPFYVTFTAGAIAGVSEILTFYPLGAPAPL
jgi:hypothetical protein